MTDDQNYELGTTEHLAWTAAQAQALLHFYVASADLVGGGFLSLDEKGHAVPGERPLYATARMTYCYSLGSLLGFPDAPRLVEHGLTALRTMFHDDLNGGWYAELDADGRRPVRPEKMTYAHAFVLLAASTAVRAGFGARDLLDEATQVYDRHLWDDEAGLARECWDPAWTETEDYRGMNANMHTFEAFLAAADATQDDRFVERSRSIAERLVGFAEESRWRIPEHFTSTWEPLPDYNKDQPADPFRPYGATPGHGLEWARLLIQLAAKVPTGGGDLLTAAGALFDRAVADGWDDGRAGFVYTTTWEGEPVVPARLHWPLTEAIGAARYLGLATGDDTYAEWYARFWRLADEKYIDHVHGGWHHELDPEGRVASTVWGGKPDQYHALQAALVAQVSEISGLAAALSPSP